MWGREGVKKGWSRERRDPTTAHNPSTAHAYPTKIFSIFQSLWKIPKTFQIIENTRNVANIVLILRSCGVKASKIQVERLRVVGGYRVIPSTVHVRSDCLKFLRIKIFEVSKISDRNTPLAAITPRSIQWLRRGG